MIPYSQASYAIDSINYPLYGIDAEGTQIVTIKRTQQLHLTTKLLELKKCTIIKDKQKKLISLLEEQSKKYEALKIQFGKIKENNSLMIEKKNKYIANLENKLKAQKAISSSFEQEKNYIAKRERRKVIGWKIGTFVLAGVSVAALTAVIIGMK